MHHVHESGRRSAAGRTAGGLWNCRDPPAPSGTRRLGCDRPPPPGGMDGRHRSRPRQYSTPLSRKAASRGRLRRHHGCPCRHLVRIAGTCRWRTAGSCPVNWAVDNLAEMRPLRRRRLQGARRHEQNRAAARFATGVVTASTGNHGMAAAWLRARCAGHCRNTGLGGTVQAGRHRSPARARLIADAAHA